MQVQGRRKKLTPKLGARTVCTTQPGDTLDKRTARDWESYKLEKDIPTLEEFKTFLTDKADMLDNLSQRYGNNTNNAKAFTNKDARISKSFVVSSGISCYYCKGTHAIYNCEKFTALSVNERLNQINNVVKLCSNCLRNTHLVKDCSSKSRGCKRCNKRHNTLLHIANTENLSAINQVFSAHASVAATHILLATVVVKIPDSKGNLHSFRALLDSASQSHFLSTVAVKTLSLKPQGINMSIQGINQVTSHVHSRCSIKINSTVNNFTLRLTCLVVDKICNDLPSVFIDHDWSQLPNNIQLADPDFNKPGKVDLLIGTQLFWSLLTYGQIKLKNGFPVVQNTQLDRILSGPISSTHTNPVFDGSCPSSNGVPVNNLQLVGATLQPDLIEILLRFRQNKVAFSADIQKIYRQILVNPNDRKFQRILWRNSPNEELETFALNTVTYGTASVPHLATRCLVQIANDHSKEYLEASQVIKTDCYINDILSTTDSIERAVKLCSEIITMLKDAHFHLHKCVSNEPSLLKALNITNNVNDDVYLNRAETTKTLGLHWCPFAETLGYKVQSALHSDFVTKRQILFSISKVFDPLGLLSPCTIIGKIILQAVWTEKMDWDEEISVPIRKRWQKLQSE
ncbi:hypothetical protein ILUMI_04338, partial [Ignelater luminosus]